MSEKPIGTRLADLEERVARIEAIALNPPMFIDERPATPTRATPAIWCQCGIGFAGQADFLIHRGGCDVDAPTRAPR